MGTEIGVSCLSLSSVFRPAACASIYQAKGPRSDPHDVQEGQAGPEPCRPCTHSLLLRILQGTSKVCASKSTTFQRTQTTKRTPQSTSSVSDNGVFISLAEGSLKLFLLRLKGQAYSEPWVQLRVGNSCSLLTGQLRLTSQISPHTSPPPGSHPLYHAEGRGGGPCLLGNIPQFYGEGAFSSDAGHGTEQEFRKHFPNNYKTSRQWRCACTR